MTRGNFTFEIGKVSMVVETRLVFQVSKLFAIKRAAIINPLKTTIVRNIFLRRVLMEEVSRNFRIPSALNSEQALSRN